MEAASDVVKSVKFSFYTPEEVRKISVKRITRPDLLDPKGARVPDGLYDPALGPLGDNDPDRCKTCGQGAARCPGHFGHIELARPLYNPLLFKNLHNLLQVTCFNCHKFRLNRQKIKRYIMQLNCIMEGDVAGARNLGDDSFTKSSFLEDGPAAIFSSGSNFSKRSLNESTWTSFQYEEARVVLSRLMKEKPKKCVNCDFRNPTITFPAYGWFNKGIQASDASTNKILGTELGLSSRDRKNTKSPHSEEDSDSQVDEEPLSSTQTAKESHLESVKQASLSGQHDLLPSEVKLILKKLWKNEPDLCSLIYDIQHVNLSKSGRSKRYLMFFLEALLVTPSKLRPARESIRGILEHSQNTLLSRVLESNVALRSSIDTNRHNADICRRWRDLQGNVNMLFDSSKGSVKDQKDIAGVRQMLEKKNGILRKHVMGKRVNFACRSVISPDPYLAVNEIGIPPSFALKLTYPERVTPWNANKLCDNIINGPDLHPGATHFKDKAVHGFFKMQPSQRVRIAKKLSTSGGVVGQHDKGPESEFDGKVVYRHLQDGDIVLVNRQPTLHKPSMMAHVVRVLKGEKTIRMHYANCSTYNADFDGDEMNVHFPQDEISRAEAFNIVNANKQYIVPTSGEPIRGLIQDHIISAVLLTKMDTFLTREEYHQLLCASCVPSAPNSQVKDNKLKVSSMCSDEDIRPLPPAIWKPMPLWTGKQVITTILNYVTRGRLPFTVKCEGRIPKEYLKKDRKDCVRIYENELVDGIIDKAQFGKYGLVHAVYEIYGADTAGTLLSVFSRLFTSFLQMHGFTCGVDDLLLVPSSNIVRERILAKSEAYSEDVHFRFTRSKDAEKGPTELQRRIEKILRNNGESATVRLDRMMSNALNNLTSEVNNSLFPDGFMKPFPRNCLSLMTTTGAKGGVVNMTQISSLLGQQELEGKRVPRMVSGKTLPCFPPWDISSRAGGFISDRFLTGLRPQEYYFHCMAGRDGLVDTAIKTSRSGYLQRCLVKNLEGLKVSYDHTVRDIDGSVVQFVYGEDGVDVLKASLLSQFKILAHNQDVLLEKFNNEIKDACLSKPNGYIQELPSLLGDKENKFSGVLKNKKMQRRSRLGKVKRQDFLKLLRLKYQSSLAEPGEAVGVVAAQSIGEPSTQMTLNTFHLAGKGEKNVTLGIPRLQEILMTASDNIRTPVMSCPLHVGKTEDDAERLAAKLRRVTVADVVEAMEVCTLPFSVHNNQVSTIYKLKITLYPAELYPPHSELTTEDCMEVLKKNFVAAMEEAIDQHLKLVYKIPGVNVVMTKEEGTSKESVEDESANKLIDMEMDDAGVTGDTSDDDLGADDLGADAERRRRQVNDEVEYEDYTGEKGFPTSGEHDEDGQSGFASEVDQGDTDDDPMGDEISVDDETTKSPDKVKITVAKNDDMKKSKLAGSSKRETKSKGEKKPNRKKSKLKRAFFVNAQGLTFEVHYNLGNEPHILLAEIAQRTAKRVWVKEFKNIGSCSVPERKKNSDPFSLQTAGVNFSSFWDLEEHLDINRIYTNDVHAVCKTYGIEVARATIIKEVSGVFGHYGIKVNIRHLSLIADFMTCHGTYRSMNRVGMGEFNTSPFGKMTFETAAKFITESASLGEVDILESPSASVSLGQPVKMGTGCFDLLQNLKL